MWPGRPKVCGVELGSARALMVSARSCADTPVEHPSSLSTVTVNGVPSTEVLSITWCGRSSSSHRLMVMGAQSTPLACFSMKFTFSAVIFSAAMIRSPSFSRSSSSTTMRNFPSLKSFTASSMLLSLMFSIYIYTLLYLYRVGIPYFIYSGAYALLSIFLSRAGVCTFIAFMSMGRLSGLCGR